MYFFNLTHVLHSTVLFSSYFPILAYSRRIWQISVVRNVTVNSTFRAVYKNEKQMNGGHSEWNYCVLIFMESWFWILVSYFRFLNVFTLTPLPLSWQRSLWYRNHSLICGANSWTAICMTGPSVVKESVENHYS